MPHVLGLTVMVMIIYIYFSCMYVIVPPLFLMNCSIVIGTYFKVFLLDNAYKISGSSIIKAFDKKKKGVQKLY